MAKQRAARDTPRAQKTLEPTVNGFSADPQHPHTYRRRVLVCLSGLVPQVITETLYALLTAPEPFVPTELHVITTSEGASRAVSLLVGDGTRPGVLQALWRDWAPEGSSVTFDPRTHIHLIADGDRILPDITHEDHHVNTADSIVAVMRPLLSDPQAAVHASLAGGRKTMSFYLGYVLSLLGREQDRLSHVLVNAPFDTLPSFTHPPKAPVDLDIPKGESVSTQQAIVRLAEVAFVRMSQQLPEQLRSGTHSFEQLVTQAQLALAGVQVTVDTVGLRVRIHRGATELATIELSPAEMGLYAFLAKVRCTPLSAEDQAKLEGHGFVKFPHKEKAQPPEAFDPPAAFVIDEIAQAIGWTGVSLQSEWAFGTLRERVSKINTKFAKALDKTLADKVRIYGPKDRRLRDGRYGVPMIQPADIHFEQHRFIHRLKGA